MTQQGPLSNEQVRLRVIPRGAVQGPSRTDVICQRTWTSDSGPSSGPPRDRRGPSQNQFGLSRVRRGPAHVRLGDVRLDIHVRRVGASKVRPSRTQVPVSGPQRDRRGNRRGPSQRPKKRSLRVEAQTESVRRVSLPRTRLVSEGGTASDRIGPSVLGPAFSRLAIGFSPRVSLLPQRRRLSSIPCRIRLC